MSLSWSGEAGDCFTSYHSSTPSCPRTTYLCWCFLSPAFSMIADIVIVRLNFLLGRQAKHDISIALVNDDGKHEFDDFTWLLELFPPLLPFDGCHTPVSTKMVLGAKFSTQRQYSQRTASGYSPIFERGGYSVPLGRVGQELCIERSEKDSWVQQ